MQGLVDATYVINLDRAGDRMRVMAAQCEQQGIPFIRVPAVDGARVRPAVRQKTVTPACQKECTNSTIGCALSHMKVWTAVLRQNQACVVVMEDDADLVPDFVRGVERALQDVPEDFDVLLLGCAMFCNKQRAYNPLMHVARFTSHISNPFALRNDPRTWGCVFVPERFSGTHCYAVSNKGCRTLLNLLPKVEGHIDMCMNHPDLKLYAVSPDLAFQRDMSDSSIASYNFPMTLNGFLETFKDQKGISLAYALGVPNFQIAGHAVNLWTQVFIFLGFAHRYTAPYVGGLFVAEVLVQGDVAMPVMAYALGWGLHRLISALVSP